MKKGQFRKILAMFMASLIFCMTSLPYLPSNLFDAWAFKLVFKTSGVVGHPYIYGRVEDENFETAFLCLDHGASAHSYYEYHKIDADVDYAHGTMEQKRLFWAYIGAFGSYDERPSMTKFRGAITKEQAKTVAWKQGTVPWVEYMATDGFMALESVPAGCKNPQDIFSVVSNYGTPETAMSMNSLLSEPGVIDLNKLYELTGLNDIATLKKYCTITALPVEPGPAGENIIVQTVYTDNTIQFRLVYQDGSPANIVGYSPDIVVNVKYDPSIFKVINVSGTLEYYKCNVEGSQLLCRAKGDFTETYPEFYLTTGKGGSTPVGGIPSGGSSTGGSSGDIKLHTYNHKETFESNYKVDLTKYDYETGLPLQNSIWQVLEAFPDQTKLTTDESDGNLAEKNMREDPTTWDNWLVFDDDLYTDENGYISYADTRWYDYNHYYCNGHPLPPEPEGDDEEAEDEYEELMAEWQAAVDACEANAAASSGTFHHWLCGSESEPSEAEAFEQSGCRACRDTAYENFINLRYSYTFRETDARDGYIIHGQGGHPDDVPVEIITTAASEAELDAVWTECSNMDIIVNGYVRNTFSSSDDDATVGGFRSSFNAASGVSALELSPYLLEGSLYEEYGLATLSETTVYDTPVTLYLTETYDLTLGQKVVNALREFVGLPEKFVTENEIAIQIVAEYKAGVATPSDTNAKNTSDDVDLIDDVSETTIAETAAAETTKSNTETTAANKETTAAAESTTTAAKETTKASEETADAEETTGTEETTKAAEVSKSKNDVVAVQLSSIDDDDDEDGYLEDDTELATYSNATYSFTSQSFQLFGASAATRSGDTGDEDYVNVGSSTQDSQPNVIPGPNDRIAHSWKVYDHRVQGQIHFSKLDMELKAGETGSYQSLMDDQGDGTKEGAVYGLFAADDIYGPDTQRDANGDVIAGTGIIFDANDLVAVATTDKLGEGSFLTITEKPHSTYNYKTGRIEVSGKDYPKNLYDHDGYDKVYSDEETGRIYKDNLGTNGDYWIGRPLILGNYYIKELTRSEGYELSITGKDMEITNATDANRAEYGETDDSKAKPVGTAWIIDQLKHAVTFPEGNATYGNRENLFNLEVGSNGTTDGYNVVVDGLPEDADFYYNDAIINPVKLQVPVGGQWVDATEAPLYETAKDGTTVKRDINGDPVINPNAVKDLPVAYTDYALQVKKVDGGATATAEDAAKYHATFTDTAANFQYVKAETEQMMRSLGIDTPEDSGYSTADNPVYDVASGSEYGMPEETFIVTGVTTNKSLIDAILNFYVTAELFTYGSIQNISFSGDTATVTVALGMNPNKTLLYDVDSSGEVTDAYLYKLNTDTNRYVMRHYTGTSVTVETNTASGRKKVTVTPDFTINAAGLPEDLMTYSSPLLEYLLYDTGDTLYDYWYESGSGNWVGHSAVRRKVYEVIYEEQDATETSYNTSQVTRVNSREEVADPVGSTYVYYDEISKQHILHVGSNDVDLSGVKSSNFTIAIADGSTTVTSEDIDKIGDNNVWGISAGDSLNDSQYIIRVSGAGAGVFTAEEFDKDTSFIKNQNLIYNGNHDTLEDGNTWENPNIVEERIIKQQIKVTKNIDAESYNNTNSYSDVHEDWFTQTFGGLFGNGKDAKKMDNFRYKVYLKSNLERLYRDNDGNVIWQDRRGNEIDVIATNETFPALVNKIFTKVQHVTAPLYKDSEDAIVSNDALYSYSGGYINENQNGGYTSILETVDILVEDGAGTKTVKSYNYDKFFDAMAVANNDKWDDGKPTYSSWQPIGNAANRTANTIENAKVSDMVRQFAIDWYLDDEIAKLVKAVPNNAAEKEDKDGMVPYSDEMYDEALRNAIIKAENYLKPFFANDLDRIYSIEWDSETNGGSDNDLKTLSADTAFGALNNDGDGYYFGLSVYLPYGTYVVAEQQPRYDSLEDFKNKHYQIDKPREVVLPSVYADYDGSQASPEVLNDYYAYNASMSLPEMEWKYKIRFAEEALNIIKGRNAEGDFEVYKYGINIDSVDNGASTSAAGHYFALTQDEFRPYKNYYNGDDDRTTGNVPYYLTEGLSGKEKVSKYYRYSSVPEKAGTANAVQFTGGVVTEDNAAGFWYKDNVATMQGIQIAYEGKFASMLVPWTVVAPDNAAAEVTDVVVQASGESSYKGYDYTKFTNRFYTSKLRIEKLDSETHENILHDGAFFNIYAAKRNDAKDGDGSVMFYTTDTTITGTKEFLEAMCAKDITPTTASFIDRLTGKTVDDLYSGVVAAGTPICDESEQIILGDSFGNQTVAFKSYSTVLDGLMKDEASNTSLVYQNQTVGYVETPQPLGAGTYVICEAKAPTGYTRSNPVAVEVYSDKVTYYKEGNKDARVLAALYEYASDNQTTNGNKPQDIVNVARIDVENAPIKLTVEKIKESSVNSANTTADKTVTYKVSGRIDGTLAAIGNNSDYEYAYDEAGVYLGYAWKKGTLEYLVERQNAGEDVQIAYEGKIFAGYGFVTKTLETADDSNKYVAGATMTLFDALEIHPSGNTQDHAYEGLVIQRNNNNDILRMYVKQGFAGTKVEFIKEKDENGNEYTVDYQAGVDKNQQPIMVNGNIWKAETIDRPDTDILYYDLDTLEILSVDNVDGTIITYGYDKNHDKVSIKQIESDKTNHPKTDTEYSIYAFKGGIPYLEFGGGDFNGISYSSINKILTVGAGTTVYHLDRDGNRDSLIDPYTGMAYVIELTESGQERILVWAINIHKDEFGNIISRDKITTSRIATIGENLDGYNENVILDVTNNSGNAIPDSERPSYNHSESGYITGTWKSENGEESHNETTVNQNSAGNNMNADVLVDDNNGQFDKELNPVYDEHGLVNYYQRSDETYDKGTNLYDRNDDFVRYQDSDNLEEYNNAAYRINDHDELYDGDETKENQSQKALYHRLGEGYVLENTWVTSDKTPNDPFDTTPMDGQADVLKRVPSGHYIMEELIAPKGYLKGMPTGVTVHETAAMQNTQMIDKTTKIEISKIDGADTQTYNLINMETGLIEGTVEEGKSSYGWGQVADAVIALYAARKVYTSDFLTYPDGYYLVRVSETAGPITYYSTENMVNHIKELTAKWVTGVAPLYIEGVPEGYYLLEELMAPGGFTTSKPVAVYISNTAEVQTVVMNDDHTKVEIAKQEVTEDGKAKQILGGAGFTLYAGNTDGSYNASDVVDSWVSEDATDYTESINLKDYPNTSGANKISGFQSEFEAMYKEYGVDGRNITWSVERKAVRSSADDNIWVLEDRTLVKVINNVITFPAGMSQEDRDGFYAAYLANTRNEDTIKWANDMSATYVSHTQIDSSSVNGNASTTKFPTTATMLFETNAGKQIQITVYQQSMNNAGTTYTFEYKFDYKALSAINKYACSYLTATGHRRFDYLPVGTTYVLVETTVPEGYAKADDTVITVSDMLDVQYYSILNETNAVRISKVAEGMSGELAGAKLGLYKADIAGDFVRDNDHLIATWITGEDGTYTDAEFVNGLIPDGYKRGDLKPHTIRGLADGIYYVAEISAPAYYTAFEPVKIDYKGQEEIQLVRITDNAVTGYLEIKKTDTSAQPLSGVTFQVTAYRYGTGDVVLDKYVSDTNGTVRVTDLPIGEMDAAGKITPYTYKVREITPPDGYAVSSVIKTFQFSPDKNGVSYEYGEFASQTMTVENEKTKIYIEKRNFTHLNDDGIDGAFIDGAVLAVYEVQGRDVDDNFIYDDSNPVETWTTFQSDQRHLIEGLVAGRTYLLKELKAPTGYNFMKPVAFTISSNGRSIYSVTNNLNTITVNYIQPSSQYLDTDNLDIDSIDSVTLTGRYVAKIEMVVTDAAGNEVAKWTSNGKPHTLLKEDGLNYNEVYTFTEYTCYSDGSRTVTDRTTKRVIFDDNGEFIVNTRTAKSTNLAIFYTDGTEITNFNPNEIVASKVVKNNVNPENPKVTMKNRNGENGDVLDSKQVVINTVAYANTSNIKTDITVTATVANNVTILDEGAGVVSGNTITWTVKDVAPATSGYVTFNTEISDTTALSTSVTATVSFNTKEYKTTKKTPIMQANKLTVYNELTGSGKTLYGAEVTEFHINLYTETGAELNGIYAYTGSKSGELRSGDVISLAGNEFITIDPGNIYKNIQYKVERIEDGSQKVFAERGTEGIAAADTGAFAVFTRTVKDTSEREIFVKGESYLLVETTTYSNGTVAESNKLQFTLNEEASITTLGGYDKESHVVISKTDITTGEELPGAHIIIKDKDGNIIEEWISTEEPHEIIGILTPGEEYTMIEEAAPDGYAYAEDITFKVNEDGSVDKVIMEDKPTRVVISKTDITTGEELPGAHIIIKDKNGNIVDEWISTGEPHEIVGKLIAGETYTMIEVGAPDGYAYAEDITFTVSLDGTIDRVVMEDKPTHISISKTDFATGKELPGASIVIKDKDGNIVDEWISTTVSHEIIGKLIAGETYTMVEVGPPNGYAYSVEIEFTVSRDGSIDKVVMQDKPTHVEISKIDVTTGDELPGAHIIIKDKDGNIVDEWISTDKPHIIIGELIAGEEYTLIEYIAPDGYGYAEEIKFTVNKDGSINTVVMEDKPTHVVISKVDITNKEELPGATLQIIDKDGNVIEEWVSTDKPHEIIGKLIAGEEYTLVETMAPNGYKIADSITFKVNRDGSINTVVMEDAKKPSGGGSGGGGGGNPSIPKYPVVVTKTNVDNELLPGAEYGIYTESGTLVASGTTDSAGKVTINVSVGSYYVQEISSPSGYSLNKTKYPVIVTSGGKEFKLDVVDDYAVIAISKLDVATLEPLDKAEFTLYTMDGTAVATANSGTEGYAEFRGVLHGDYYIMETGAPSGYILSPEQRFVSINKFYVNAAPIIWYNHPDELVGRPRTGDDSPIVAVAVAFLFTAAGYFIISSKLKKKNENNS